MSSASGTAIGSEGQALGHFRYDGTADIVIPALFATADELSRAWRQEPDRWEPCAHELTPVTLATTYGGGFSWPGKVCLKCMAVREGRAPWDEGVEITDASVS